MKRLLLLSALIGGGLVSYAANAYYVQKSYLCLSIITDHPATVDGSLLVKGSGNCRGPMPFHFRVIKPAVPVSMTWNSDACQYGALSMRLNRVDGQYLGGNCEIDKSENSPTNQYNTIIVDTRDRPLSCILKYTSYCHLPY